MNAGMAFSQFQSVQGPVDDRLRHSELEGYQPISRIGEVVINSFVDAYEFAQLPEAVNQISLDGDSTGAAGTTVEFKPHFHEWATVLPGMICISRKARNATFRNYVAAETATPVIGCCACLTLDDAKNFYFAGVCRSKTVRPIDDGVGPQVDEFFTLAIGGMVTMINNSKDPIFPGDMIEWTFYNEKNSDNGRAAKRTKTNPRRISIKIASPTSERVIGRCLSFAKPVRTSSNPLFSNALTHTHCPTPTDGDLRPAAQGVLERSGRYSEALFFYIKDHSTQG
jgi:hypothetical protein